MDGEFFISPPGRGAATLSKLLYSLEHLDEDRSAIDINALVPKALPLNVSRIAVPKHAGGLDPQKHFSNARARAVAEQALSATPPGVAAGR